MGGGGLTGVPARQNVGGLTVPASEPAERRECGKRKVSVGLSPQ